MRLLINAFAVCLLLFAFDSQAGPGPFENIRLPILAADGTTFSAEALSSPVSTDVVAVKGLRFVTLYAFVDYASASALSTVCRFGGASNDVNYQAQSKSISSGVATYSDYSITKAIGADKRWPMTFSVNGYNYMSCTFTATGATSDTLDVSVYGGVN